MWNRDKKFRYKEANARITLKLGLKPFNYEIVARDDTGKPTRVDRPNTSNVPGLMIVRCPPTTCKSPGHADVGQYQTHFYREPLDARYVMCIPINRNSTWNCERIQTDKQKGGMLALGDDSFGKAPTDERVSMGYLQVQL
jgi:hypothetical protein